MKNQTLSLLGDTTDVHALRAIQRIQDWIEENYPRLAAVSRSRLIRECLLEVTEERKFIAAQ